MKIRMRILCLLLCLCLVCTAGIPAFAAAESAAIGISDNADGLFDGIPDSIREFVDGQSVQFKKKLHGMLEKYDLDSLGEDLKTVLKTSAELSDEELASAISGLAAQHGANLEDSQIAQLCQLCRGLEKFSGEELEKKLEALKKDAEAILHDTEETSESQEIPGTQQKAAGFFQKLRNAVTNAVAAVRVFFERLKKQK